MVTVLLVLILVVTVVAVVFGALVWRRMTQPVGSDGGVVLREELGRLREEAARDARLLREEVATAQRQAIGELTQAVREWADGNRRELTEQRDRIQTHLQQAQRSGEERFEQVRRAVDEKLQQVIEDQRKYLTGIVEALRSLERSNADAQRQAREALDAKLLQIQESNERKLEEMRRTVDEKLQSTLEKRLGESFRLVSTQLEAVQQGLGEMRTLATGVGDLKRVLTNVRERGTWGEYQLAAILEQILTPEQFARNVVVQGRDVVEFAVKLPGRDEGAEPVWLPIDSKFPKEDYERLQQAAQAGDQDGVQQAKDALLRRISEMAKLIREKYIAPPKTTDFAILFVPTEGLYAEVLREPGFHDRLQREHRVLVAGPTTLAAILNSLRVGFQTLAIEKRAHEVWTILGAVKTEFGRFGEVLDKLKRQLNIASKTVEDAGVRTRAMERQLRRVEALPAAEAPKVLGLPADVDTPPGEDEEDNAAT